MADIKVCDRCGKRLAEERSIFTVKPNRHTLNVTLFKKPRYYSTTLDMINTTHDLCMDCTNELSTWLAYETSLEEEKNG